MVVDSAHADAQYAGYIALHCRQGLHRNESQWFRIQSPALDTATLPLVEQRSMNVERPQSFPIIPFELSSFRITVPYLSPVDFPASPGASFSAVVVRND